jgi:hypothetical protein
MASASWALQQAVFTALGADAGLISLLGGNRVYDDVPERAEFPYVTFALSNERDWSTSSEEGSEHLLTLHVWSRAAGRKEAHEIMGALRRVLHDAGLALTGYRLVNLRHEFSEARRDPDGETYHGILRYRAVTEPTA